MFFYERKEAERVEFLNLVVEEVVVFVQLTHLTILRFDLHFEDFFVRLRDVSNKEITENDEKDDDVDAPGQPDNAYLKVSKVCKV